MSDNYGVDVQWKERSFMQTAARIKRRILEPQNEREFAAFARMAAAVQ